MVRGGADDIATASLLCFVLQAKIHSLLPGWGSSLQTCTVLPLLPWAHLKKLGPAEKCLRAQRQEITY